MSDTKVIAVVGATGAQGGGLARAILADPDGGFAVRALTRDPSKEAAQALAAAGCGGRPGRPRRRGEPRAAFEGAHGAFCVTNFWEHFSAEKEIEQASNRPPRRRRQASSMRSGRRSRTRATFIPLDDDRMPTLQDRFKVPHFDAKEEANALLHRRGRPDDVPLHRVLLGELHLLRRRPGSAARTATLALTYPDGRREAARDRRRGHRQGRLRDLQGAAREYIGKSVFISGENLSGTELAAAFSKALGEEVVYNDVDAGRLPRRSTSRARTRWGTCSSSSATSRRSTPVRVSARRC